MRKRCRISGLERSDKRGAIRSEADLRAELRASGARESEAEDYSVAVWSEATKMKTDPRGRATGPF
jgi:hypothetical protein